jgi:hypothetical protein
MRKQVASILPDSGEVMIVTGADREAFLAAQPGSADGSASSGYETPSRTCPQGAFA